MHILCTCTSAWGLQDPVVPSVSIPTKPAVHGTKEALNCPKCLQRNHFLCLAPESGYTILGSDPNWHFHSPQCNLVCPQLHCFIPGSLSEVDSRAVQTVLHRGSFYFRAQIICDMDKWHLLKKEQICM